MNLELNIEALVLHGFEARDRHRIGRAFTQELGRLFAERGVPEALASGGEIRQLDAGSFHLPADAHPATTGTRVAQLVYAGLTKVS